MFEAFTAATVASVMFESGALSAVLRMWLSSTITT